MGYLDFVDIFSEAGSETPESVNEDRRVYSRGKMFPLQDVNERWNHIHPIIK